MRLMQEVFTTVIATLLLFLSSCNSGINSSSRQQQGNPANCPQPLPSLPAIAINSEAGFYDAFDYRIHKILADLDTIKFQSNNYDFVFCRGNGTWTIQLGTLQSKSNQFENYEAYMAELADPKPQTVELNGNIYQYRVLLDPNPFPNFQQEAQQVVFELIALGTQQPQKQVLYTLEQTKESKAGIKLGVPQITATLSYDNRLFWTVSPEQGEGNGGIGTIVSYDPETEKIEVIQPEAIAKQQINDMAIAGDSSNPTFWIATQISGEGNPSLPSMGLVAYNPDSQDPESGSVNVYHIRNSPIVGAIPSQLKLEADWLWVGTGNGICQIEWQAAEKPESWSCWRFALTAELPETGLPLYNSLFSEQPATSLKFNENNPTVEVLWWLPTDRNNEEGRYEIRYDEGFTVKLDNQGAIPWSEFYPSSDNVPSWKSPIYWPGMYWHWNGDRFERGFDEVSPNFVGGGVMGIGLQEFREDYLREMYSIRGDLDLLNLSRNTTEVKYYSAWIDESLLEPRIAIIPDQYPQKNPQKKQSNPLRNEY